MINSTSHPILALLFPFGPPAALLKDDLLDPVDQLLEDPALLDLAANVWRHAAVRTGRPTIAPDRLLRCCVMSI